MASANDAKTVKGISGGYDASDTPPMFCIYWSASTSAPTAKKGYRINWSLKKSGFRSYKKVNILRAGSSFVNDTSHCWDIGATSDTHTALDWQYNQILRIRIRARYNGEKNGPWSRIGVGRFRSFGGYTSPDISVRDLSPPPA